MRSSSTPARAAHLAPVRALGRPLTPGQHSPCSHRLLAASEQQKLQRGAWGRVETPNHCCHLQTPLKPQTAPGAAPAHSKGSSQKLPPFRVTPELEEVWGVVLLLLKKAAWNETQQRSQKQWAAWCATHGDTGGIFVRQARTDGFCRETHSRDGGKWH